MFDQSENGNIISRQIFEDVHGRSEAGFRTQNEPEKYEVEQVHVSDDGKFGWFSWIKPSVFDFLKFRSF